MASAIELERYQYFSHRHCKKFSAYFHHNTSSLAPNWATRKLNDWHARRILASPTLSSCTRTTKTPFPSTFFFNTFRLFFYHGFAITLRHTKPYSVGLFWTSDQLVAETSTRQHTTLNTDIHATGGIRTHNPSKRAAADPRLKTPGHSDQYLPPAVPSKPVFCLKPLCLYLICYIIFLHLACKICSFERVQIL